MRQTATQMMLAYFQSRPFAIERHRFRSLVAWGQERADAVARMTPGDIEAAVAAYADRPLGQMIGAIAVIPIVGCITQKSDFYSWYFGGTSIDRLTAAFRQYANDPQVSTIVFNVDSPGGEVFGTPECAAELLAGRELKKTVAICNPCMASAAYWLSSAASEIWMLPSAQVGSIGCYTLHADISAMLKEIGVDITFIQYGAHKTDGNPYEPLSEDAHADLQAHVNFYGIAFDRAVAAGRDVSEAEVKAKFGQGRMFTAPDAKRIGLVDTIGTMDELLAKLAPKRARVAAAEAPAAAPTTPAIVAADDVVDANADGSCPDGYEKGDDGKCYLPEAKAKADVERQDAAAQEDAESQVAVTLALTES